mgnify:CR=1 FL=1|jgi:hypothetical protein
MAEIRVKETGTIKLFESDNTSSVTIASPASLGADRTITLPDGDVTLVAGTMSTGGVALTGSTDNTVTTVTGADAIAGEANLIFDGTKLGIGETAPLGLVHARQADSGASVNDPDGYQGVFENSANSGITILSGNGNNGHVLFGDDGDNDIGRIVYRHADNSLAFDTNAGEAMRITSGNLVGIGVTPTAAIHAVRDSTTLWAGHIENEAATNYGRVLKLVLDNDFDDNSSVFCIAYGSTNERFKVFSSGDVENHDNSYGGISDERVKQDIRDANSQWDDIKALKVRNFKRKDDVRQYGENAWEQIGVVAQEAELVSPKLVKESLPSASDILSDSAFGTLYTEQDKTDGIIPEDKKVGDVKTTTDEKVKGMKYSVLYMKAIKALQESMERIETLEAKVTALENK